jgi:hypothetical protein
VTERGPEAGLVISYAYLWHSEFVEGLEEGHKDRPCVIIGVEPQMDDAIRVLVVPITHSSPVEVSLVQEIPEVIKRHLRLDEGRCWIMLSEWNEFQWPGPDLRRSAPGDSLIYERLPPRFFEKTRQRFVELAGAGRSRPVKRTE